MMDAQKVIVGNWDVKMEASFLALAASEECYSYDSLPDLLLLIGNTLSRHELHKLLSNDQKVSVLMSMFYVKFVFSISLFSGIFWFFMLIKCMKLNDSKI